MKTPHLLANRSIRKPRPIFVHALLSLILLVVGDFVWPRLNLPSYTLWVIVGMAEIGLGRIPLVKMNDVGLKNGNFRGSTEGVLIRRPGFQGVSVLEFQLRREGNRMIGICDTYAKGYFELSHWVELENQA